MNAHDTLLTVVIVTAIPIGIINLILLLDIYHQDNRHMNRTPNGNLVSQGGVRESAQSRPGLSSAPIERPPDGKKIGDAIASQLNLSRAEVRRTMLAGGVVHDGTQLRDPDELARYYRGQEIAYGRRGTRVVIEGADE